MCVQFSLKIQTFPLSLDSPGGSRECVAYGWAVII